MCFLLSKCEIWSRRGKKTRLKNMMALKSQTKIDDDLTFCVDPMFIGPRRLRDFTCFEDLELCV